MKSKITRDMEKDIARRIHYPECWDTACYSSLVIALWEMTHWKADTKCPECGKTQGLYMKEVKA